MTSPLARLIQTWSLVGVVMLVQGDLSSGGTPLSADEPPSPTNTESSSNGKESDTSHDRIQSFLNDYCVNCHGKKEQKGDRRFDVLAPQIKDDNTLVDYQDILDQLNLGDMPPEESKQPSDDRRRQVIRFLGQKIDRFHRSRDDQRGDAVLRRLNAREYRNTVRDLLHLNMTMFDPTRTFPSDQTSEHLDNIGDALVTSGHLLARYLEAADLVIDRAMTPLEKPQVQTWTFRDGFRQQPEIDQVHRKTTLFKHLTLYEVVGADKHEGAYGPIHAFAEGVPTDGVYQIRLKAEAVNRLHPYDPEFLGTDPSEPLRLGIVAGDHTAGNLHLPQPNEPLLVEIELADRVDWYTVRVWLDRGITPRFTFQNGLMDVRNLWSRLLRKYPDQFPKNIGKGIVAARFNAIKHGKLPQIHIHEIEISGPHYPRWPTHSHRALVGDDWEEFVTKGSLDQKRIREHIANFVSRAYRRPATREDVDRIMQVIRVRQEAGRAPIQAFADGLKAALCSPNFLYLDPTAGPSVIAESASETEASSSEGDSSESNSLSSFALASRLSYFLWASMPDRELTELAASGELNQPSVLRSQVRRMLEDPRSDALVDGFLASWLTLRDLGATPPDRSDFRPYYHYHLDRAMRQETHLFLRHLIDENLDIANFVDSDFTFVNKPLAKLYGIPWPGRDGFERVQLTDPRRGGLLGQASVLTVTANGIDTSPVVRGVWILENLLGTPPSPPPPDVEPLDPDVRGAKSIRDQLKKHRDVASCNDCHRKIDPLGFALENFDPIGRWRPSYGRGVQIDASGRLPGGHTFDDVVGFKQILMQRKEQFSRALAQKLLTYAVGRHLQPADRPQVDSILSKIADQGDGMRDLITEVVLSEPFRAR